MDFTNCRLQDRIPAFPAIYPENHDADKENGMSEKKKISPAPVKGKNGIKRKIEEKKHALMQFLNDVYLGEETYNRISGKTINMVKVFIISTRKFMIDDCLTKASSIAYTIVVSLIPTLTVVLTFYSIFSGVGGKKDELFSRVSLFLLEHNIKLNVDPLFAAISGLIENAGKIGGIGAVIVIFSATAMLRSLEKSLNNIYRVKRQRPLFLKIIYYWAALTLGPVMLIAGTTVATQISQVLSSPNYTSAFITDKNHTWVVGHKASILHSENGDLRFNSITQEAIDFDNQETYRYNANSGTFEVTDFRLEPIDYNKKKFYDLQFLGKRGWIVGNDGVVLSSTDRGSTWVLSKWGELNLRDIEMISPVRGFIAADSGVLLETTDGGKNWKTREWEGVNENFNSITRLGDRIIITGSRGIIIDSNDRGKTWNINKIDAARVKDRYVNLNSCFILDKNNIWITGNEGTILMSSDSGKTWKNRKFKRYNFNTAFFFNRNNGFVAGDSGIMIHTKDGGKRWSEVSQPSHSVNRMLYRNKKLWVIGNSGMVMVSGDQGNTWLGEDGGNFIAYLVNFFAPFVFIWILFLMAYMSLPNTKVPFRQASIGAAFTGTVWVIFILIFILYIKAFAKGTFAIYGALASIPLFLLMIYSSAVIILFGAEVSYTLMHPETYRTLRRKTRSQYDVQVYYGIALLHYIYERFEKGNGASYFRELSRVVSHRVEQLDYFMQLFLDKKLVLQNSDLGYIPANSSENVRLADVMDIIHTIGYNVPGTGKKTPFKSHVRRIFNEMNSSRKNVIGETTLRDLIKKG